MSKVILISVSYLRQDADDYYLQRLHFPYYPFVDVILMFLTGILLKKSEL
ncbi:hypothetical protein LTSEMIN_4401 [Salmonella enterica subsp. enterica serovar Minnesota str. A4-603]|nr:hypothetical protein LTSEMIN_4401 [Salmonella enterica subsp. enterica serovar Minnesota str. A4-603]